MPPATDCYRCGKPLDEHRKKLGHHVYCEHCGITVARRTDPALARLMESNRTHRFRQAAAFKRIDEAKAREA